MICNKCGKLKEEFYKGYKICKSCKKSYQNSYRLKNMEKARLRVRKCIDIKRFGAPRETILKERCEYCGGTKRLSIHHKDGNGRRTHNPNNSPSNLETLCNQCHTKLHQRKAKRYNLEYQAFVLTNWSKTNAWLAKSTGVSASTIHYIRKEIGDTKMLLRKLAH